MSLHSNFTHKSDRWPNKAIDDKWTMFAKVTPDPSSAVARVRLLNNITPGSKCDVRTNSDSDREDIYAIWAVLMPGRKSRIFVAAKTDPGDRHNQTVTDTQGNSAHSNICRVFVVITMGPS